MEIVLKTKQAGNAQFKFLSFDNPLNPYYKHVVRYIKEGRYTPTLEAQDEEEGSCDAYILSDPPSQLISSVWIGSNANIFARFSFLLDEDDDYGHYLHPSLFADKSDAASQVSKKTS